MSLKTELYTYLTGISAVTDEVSTRIYPGIVPSSATTPYISYERIVASHEHHLGAATGLKAELYQFDIYSEDSVTTEDASEALREALDGRLGDMGAEGVSIVSLLAERDTFIPPTDASQVGLWNTSMDFEFWVTESVPTF